jgi:bifunctional DNase/RNase
MIAATNVGFTQMRIAKVVGAGRPAEEEFFQYVVLDEVSGDRRLVIQIGETEAFSLTASLGGMRWGRPMTYQFAAALVRGLGGRVRQVRLDRLEAGAYAATVEVEGSLGVELVDARASDALNLAAVLDAPIFAAPEVLADCETRQRGDSAEATLLRQALTAPPMTIMKSEA